jgi:hypothetical protein
MGIDENEMADQLARQFSALSLIGPEPPLAITGKVAMGVIRGCNMRSIGIPFMDRRQLRAFLKDLLKKKKSGELLSLSIN